MRRQALILVFALAACGRDGEAGKNETTPGAPKAAVQTAQLTGLYEGGTTPQRNQMCIIDPGTGDARFGMVVWGWEMHSCSGSGQAVRQGNVLRLTMSGDEQCRIEARIQGTRVTLPETLPEGCSYYCGARARMSGASFDKTGGTAEDAMRAVDLVGDPLCATAR